MYFKFNTELNDEDYIYYNVFFQTQTTEGKKILKYSRMVLIGFSLAMLLIVSLASQSLLLSAVSFFTLLVINIVFCMRKEQNARSGAKRVVKLSRKLGNELYSKNAVMEFFDETFSESVDGIRTELQYSAVQTLRVLNGRYLFFQLNKEVAYILPFRSFSSNEECTYFIDFLRTKIQNVEFY